MQQPLISIILESLRSNADSGRLHAFGRIFSFGQINKLAARVRFKLAETGISQGDRVAALLPTSLELISTYLATLSLRAVYMPLNPAFPPEQLRYMLEHSQAKALVTNNKLKGKIGGFVDDLGDLEKLLVLEPNESQDSQEALIRESDDFSADDIAMLIYTSGTTGDPKGAMITSGNLGSNVQALIHTWEITASDRLLIALPLFHMHGLGVALNCALVTGCTMFLHERFDADVVLDAIEKEKLTLFMGVPTMYHRILKALEARPRDLTSMRLFISGSAPLSPQLFERFKQVTGYEILERYGLTETVMNTSNPFDGKRVPGSIGMPLPGIEAKVVDEKGIELPVGEVGEILVKGPNVFKGYWRNKSATDLSFSAGFFKTGDLGKKDDEGYFYLVGRKKELIISRGFNIYPREVEEVLEAHPSVKEAAVFGVDDADLGEKVCAAIVPEHKEKAPELLKTKLVSYLKEKVVGYKVPKEWVFVAELPRNAMGKVVKAQLKMPKKEQEGTSK